MLGFFEKEKIGDAVLDRGGAATKDGVVEDGAVKRKGALSWVGAL